MPKKARETKLVPLTEFKEKVVSIITCDGRNIVGTLKGLDQVTNVVLEDCHERVYSKTEGVQQEVLGLYIIRGQNVGIIGIVDDELDKALDLTTVRGQNCKIMTN